MTMIKTSELRKLDVVNMEEGRYLGSVCDLDVDPDTGRVLALIVDEVRPFRFWGGRHADLEIPWKDVVLVGADVVLVKNRTWKR
ncbi:MAG: YlmC/YmxH family sporulation protein [Bacillota bacterium]|jgi:YlmC/YmxH family sporulation protein|nr:YlmC/YmxH family sporulation protein [Bacillota bacterium]NLJ03248.1 YlmC/YmxH family sporulation protein [Bacillota bacterium]